jgi:hypothetical protein
MRGLDPRTEHVVWRLLIREEAAGLGWFWGMLKPQRTEACWLQSAMRSLTAWWISWRTPRYVTVVARFSWPRSS